ncbi:MAG: bifunctional nuclease family protein [bacterium]
MRVEMKASGLAFDPLTNMAIVILKDEMGNRILPIWIGLLEANSIALELEKVHSNRPLTHDLIKSIFDTLNVDVRLISIVELKDNTFYANIEVFFNKHIYRIDSRPSDAIAVALKNDVPIMVEEAVINKSKTFSSSIGKYENFADPEMVKKWLEDLKPEDFGKYEQ